jgi:hypothetical protein
MQRIRRGIKVDTATERWCSMKEIMEHLGVSRDTVLPWIDKKICLPQKLADFGDLKSAKLTLGQNQAVRQSRLVK